MLENGKSRGPKNLTHTAWPRLAWPTHPHTVCASLSPRKKLLRRREERGPVILARKDRIHASPTTPTTNFCREKHVPIGFEFGSIAAHTVKYLIFHLSELTIITLLLFCGASILPYYGCARREGATRRMVCDRIFVSFRVHAGRSVMIRRIFPLRLAGMSPESHLFMGCTQGQQSPHTHIHITHTQQREGRKSES